MVSISVALCGGAVGLCSWLYSQITAPGFRVADKHVFVTGGSSGLGLAIAKRTREPIPKPRIVARDAEKLQAAKREIESWESSEAQRHPVLALQCDITNYVAVQDAIAQANAFHHRVTDHIICNAGVSSLFQEHTINLW